MIYNNVIENTDSYKLGHWSDYPPLTEHVYSYFESRSGGRFPETTFFGLQYILKEYLCGKVVTLEKIDEAEELIDAHMGPGVFNRAGWEYIVDKHNGYLPLEIKAVPEGTSVPLSNIMMSVVNTDPKCYWLTNYVESVLTHVWYSSVVATLSRSVKKVIAEGLAMTADDMGGLEFMLHDFGYRGGTSNESAAIGGAAHLTNFVGTDTIPAMRLLWDYYGAETIPGFSVRATEHSVMTAEGRDGEYRILDRLLKDHPTGILSVVADSYDIYKFVDAVIARKDQILARDGVFVVRPDSTTKQHTFAASLMEHLMKQLADGFGTTTNSKGFEVLPPQIRLLWGDGIQIEQVDQILRHLRIARYSASNIATFGMGGGLIQKGLDRDTQRSAFKSSAQKRNGRWYDIFKDPLDASKLSKKGKLKLVDQDGVLVTVAETDPGEDIMQTVFLNGRLVTEYTLDDIRANTALEV